jgi:hypothetical protein
MNNNEQITQDTPNAVAEDILSTKSSKKGIAGLLETTLRKYRVGSFITALIPLYLVAIVAMGLALTPGIYLFTFILEASSGWPQIFHFMAIGISIISGYMLYGLSLIFIVPFFNFILPFRIKPFRGSFYSLYSVPWYIHNALTYIVRYTFLEFITPTPLNILFYKMMGMKIGKGVQINTTNISDPALIEIGDYVTIGGSAHLFAHYGQKGYLVVSKVTIGDGVNIGLKATIMGDVQIGAGAMIGPHEVILPKTRIPAGRKPEMGK